jgi:hypothetical protein
MVGALEKDDEINSIRSGAGRLCGDRRLHAAGLHGLGGVQRFR